MAERAAAHEDRNLARMLTPAERRDKKLRKLVGEDDGLQKHVALYKASWREEGGGPGWVAGGWPWAWP